MVLRVSCVAVVLLDRRLFVFRRRRLHKQTSQRPAAAGLSTTERVASLDPTQQH